MKTAISIPDGVFSEADAAAKRAGISRSEFYVRALRAYLDRFRDDWITEKLNEVYDGSEDMDPIIDQASTNVLRHIQWEE